MKLTLSQAYAVWLLTFAATVGIAREFLPGPVVKRVPVVVVIDMEDE